MKYSKDKKVVFNPENHTYFMGSKQLTSVTTLLSRFKNKFDSDYWSGVIAKREKTTKEEILARWKEKAFKSTEIGTAIHKIFEDFTDNKYAIVNGEIEVDFPELAPEYFTEFYHKAVVSAQFIKDFFLTGRLTPIHSEFIVYNDQIAGQIDMIAKDRNDNFYILDFKTNEKIDYNSYDKKMLGDLSFLNDASYWHYCLQLSIYKELIKEYKVNQIYIVHITTEKYEFIKCEDVLQKISLEQIINQKL